MTAKVTRTGHSTADFCIREPRFYNYKRRAMSVCWFVGHLVCHSVSDSIFFGSRNMIENDEAARDSLDEERRMR